MEDKKETKVSNYEYFDRIHRILSWEAFIPTFYAMLSVFGINCVVQFLEMEMLAVMMLTILIFLSFECQRIAQLSEDEAKYAEEKFLFDLTITAVIALLILLKKFILGYVLTTYIILGIFLLPLGIKYLHKDYNAAIFNNFELLLHRALPQEVIPDKDMEDDDWEFVKTHENVESRTKQLNAEQQQVLESIQSSIKILRKYRYINKIPMSVVEDISKPLFQIVSASLNAQREEISSGDDSDLEVIDSSHLQI